MHRNWWYFFCLKPEEFALADSISYYLMCLSQYQKSKMSKIKTDLHEKQKNIFLMIFNLSF